jgi:molecular chaperone GrpE (heat shock protein)
MNGTGLDRWVETREMLTELIEWLDDARQWADAATSHEPMDEEARQAAHAFHEAEQPAMGHSPPDLHHIVAELIALRQEVKLQTRAARQDRELAGKAVEELSGALAQLEHWRADESARRDSAVAEARRGTADLLVDLHDALSRSIAQADRVVRASIRSIESLRSHLVPGPFRLRQVVSAVAGLAEKTNQRLRSMFFSVPRQAGAVSSATGARPQGTPSNESLGGSGSPGNPGSVCDELAAIARGLDGLTEGNALALRRIERALAEFEIEPIEAVGRCVDSETMEVVQSVCDAAQSPGIVLAEVRRGYRRQGRIMRCAQVVVTRGNA